MTPFVLSPLLLLMLTAIRPSATAVLPQRNMSLSVSEVIGKANDGISTRLEHGDIRPNLNRNADPCTARGCKWPKRGTKVYVPIYIAPSYSSAERNIIIRGLLTFHASTCIRFVWRRRQRNYLSFYSGSGCWSYLGRQRRGQAVSLQRNGCLYQDTVQHEVLHALGFHHEQVRSDRDTYISILTQNIQPGLQPQFEKVATNNLDTPYDFDSVMQYSNFAFTKNGQPTIVSKSDPNMRFGYASTMSANDIERINTLYQCCE